MQIDILGAEYIDHTDADKARLLAAAVQRAHRQQNVEQATIYINEREKNGWLEYILNVRYNDGGKLTIGCIIRQPGADVECHS